MGRLGENVEMEVAEDNCAGLGNPKLGMECSEVFKY